MDKDVARISVFLPAPELQQLLTSGERTRMDPFTHSGLYAPTCALSSWKGELLFLVWRLVIKEADRHLHSTKERVCHASGPAPNNICARRQQRTRKDSMMSSYKKRSAFSHPLSQHLFTTGATILSLLPPPSVVSTQQTLLFTIAVSRRRSYPSP